MGDFANGTMEGDGLWRNEKGEKYVGKWKDGRAHGQGIYSTESSYYQGSSKIIQAHLVNLWNMATEWSCFRMEINIVGFTSTVNHMGEESISGRVELDIRDNLTQD